MSYIHMHDRVTFQVPKLKEPRSLYCVPRTVIPPKWPVGIDVICPPPVFTIKHQPPPFTEEFYKRPSGHSMLFCNVLL